MYISILGELEAKETNCTKETLQATASPFSSSVNNCAALAHETSLFKVLMETSFMAKTMNICEHYQLVDACELMVTGFVLHETSPGKLFLLSLFYLANHTQNFCNCSALFRILGYHLLDPCGKAWSQLNDTQMMFSHPTQRNKSRADGINKVYGPLIIYTLW